MLRCMMGVCLVGMVEDAGIWYGWKSGSGRLVGYIECLWF